MATQKPRVLLAEDDSTQQDWANVSLSELANLTIVADARRAYKELSNVNKYDFLITDWHLPLDLSSIYSSEGRPEGQNGLNIISYGLGLLLKNSRLRGVSIISDTHSHSANRSLDYSPLAILHGTTSFHKANKDDGGFEDKNSPNYVACPNGIAHNGNFVFELRRRWKKSFQEIKEWARSRGKINALIFSESALEVFPFWTLRGEKINPTPLVETDDSDKWIPLKPYAEILEFLMA